MYSSLDSSRDFWKSSFSCEFYSLAGKTTYLYMKQRGSHIKHKAVAISDSIILLFESCLILCIGKDLQLGGVKFYYSTKDCNVNIKQRTKLLASLLTSKWLTSPCQPQACMIQRSASPSYTEKLHGLLWSCKGQNHQCKYENVYGLKCG